MAEYYGSKIIKPTTTLTNVTVRAPEAEPIPHVSTEEIETLLAEQTQTEKDRQTAAIDHATQEGITALERAEEDAQEQFQTQRDQVDLDEAKALDNHALYAEARGDKGGIGQAQYDTIRNTAAQNRLTVNRAQTKLATDTARQIADLRAEGDFKKADALLSLTQQYLSELAQLKTWALETNLDVDKFNASLRQWEAEFQLSQAELGLMQEQRIWDRGQEEKDQLADAGWTLLDAGVMPNALQLQAMEMTEPQALAYLQGRKGSGRGGKGKDDRTPVEKNLHRDLLNRSMPETKPKESGGNYGVRSISKNVDMEY